MSISGIIPPQKEELKQNPDGSWDSVHSVAEVQGRGLAGLPAEERKKIEKELERERKKVDGYNPAMSDDYPFSVGGYGHWTEKNVQPEKYWRRPERGQWDKFMRMRYRLTNEFIPTELEALRKKMLKTFSTTDPQQFKQMLNANMQNNPRLDVKTRRGLVKTTVADQAVFARHASSEGGKS